LSPSRPTAPPGSPRATLAQRVIDALLGISGRASAPALTGAQRLWLEALAHPGVSAAAARIADLELPRPVLRRLIQGFIRLYGVDVSEAAGDLDDYPTFNAFFTRALRAGARPIDPAADVLVAPADARLERLGRVDPRGRIPEVKGRRFAVADLLGGAADPARFAGGPYAVLYLSPRDYHRVHSPVDGDVLGVTPLPGRTYPVNRLGTRLVPGLFAVNKRVVFHLASPDLGEVAAVMVGATNVGRITTELAAGDAIARGDELGIFWLGSTVVLLASDRTLAPAEVYEGELLKVGQALFRRQG